MKVNGKDYPIYYGKYNMFETTKQSFISFICGSPCRMPHFQTNRTRFLPFVSCCGHGTSPYAQVDSEGTRHERLCCPWAAKANSWRRIHREFTDVWDSNGKKHGKLGTHSDFSWFMMIQNDLPGIILQFAMEIATFKNGTSLPESISHISLPSSFNQYLWILKISGWWLSHPSWKIWKSLGMIIPNILWKNKIHVPNHQPVVL